MAKVAFNMRNIITSTLKLNIINKPVKC